MELSIDSPSLLYTAVTKWIFLMISRQRLADRQTRHIDHCERMIAILSRASGQEPAIGEFRRQIVMANKAKAVIDGAS